MGHLDNSMWGSMWSRMFAPSDSGLGAQADALIDQFHIRHVAHKKAGELSYGQQKLVDIAMAFMSDPALVLLDEKKYDEALAAVQAAPVEAMTALFADARGDILVAQQKASDARSAYQLALDKTDAKSPYRGVIQGKLEALGDAK